MDPRRANPQGLTGKLATLRSEKGGDRTGYKAAETGSRSRAAGSDRDLGRRLRAARQ